MTPEALAARCGELAAHARVLRGRCRLLEREAAFERERTRLAEAGGTSHTFQTTQTTQVIPPIYNNPRYSSAAGKGGLVGVREALGGGRRGGGGAGQGRAG